MNWNVYSRILDEKLGDAEYEFGQAEKKYKATKARVEALRVEKQAFEESLQVKMDEIDPEFAKQTIETSNPTKDQHWLLHNVGAVFKPIIVPDLQHFAVGVDMDKEGNAHMIAGTKLTKEDHDAVQLSIFFSGNI